MKPQAELQKKLIVVGRRFGKTSMLYHTIVNSLPVSEDKKKELHKLYEKAMREGL